MNIFPGLSQCMCVCLRVSAIMYTVLLGLWILKKGTRENKEEREKQKEAETDFYIFILYWRKLDLQHCVSFRYTVK